MTDDTDPVSPVGKTVGRKTYFHVDALDAAVVPRELAERLARAESRVGLQRGRDFNLVRVDSESGELALLNYPDFFDDAFPALAASWRLEPDGDSVTHRTYADSLNPPISHRLR